MSKKLRILILEDTATDAELIEDELRKERILFSSKLVETKEAFVREVKDLQPDIILADYSLPQFDGMTALKIVRKMAPAIPFIVVTGSINEETAVECIKAGAVDYVLKGNLTRLVPAVKAALDKKRLSKQKQQAEKELQKSEEKYRTIFEESKDVIYISSIDGKFLDINPAGVNLFDYDSVEELMSVNIQETIYTNPLDRKKFQDTLNKQGFVTDYEINLKRKNGEKLIVLDTASAVKDENDNIKGYRGIIRDITKQKELERQLLQAQKMEAIGTLAGGIAHDFNNILGAILGYTELTIAIVEEDRNEKTIIRRNLEQVYRASLRAKDLIQHILTFSRQSDHKPQSLKFNLILKEALKLLRASLPATIDICQEIDTNSQYILGDPTQIHQIIMNLCTNAYDAMREKGGVLKVQLNSVEINEEQSVANINITPGKYLKLTVSDTGMGINDEIIKRIFDPFFTTKEAGAGTGLGLSVVHGIVKNHYGEITVESKPRRGTTFNIYFPEFEPKEENASVENQELLIGTENILYIDDEESLVQTGKQILEKLGYKVTGKTRSNEALELFKQYPEQFDLVLTDQMMPKMTGIDLAKKILDIRPDIPIILITGYSEIMTHQY
jgi:PAS domain S-box-containing protein